MVEEEGDGWEEAGEGGASSGRGQVIGRALNAGSTQVGGLVQKGNEMKVKVLAEIESIDK